MKSNLKKDIRGREDGMHGTELEEPRKDIWANLEVRPAAGRGVGLFASGRILVGSVIALVEGTVRRSTYDGDPSVGATWYGVGHETWVEPNPDSPARFVNHSCEPTAALTDGLAIVALRDLSPDDEVTVDYATTEEDPSWSMPCRCGSPKCRGVVRARARFPG